MHSKRSKINLSKSKFLAGLQCFKRLYLLYYQPELIEEPDELLQSIFDQGKEVGLLAHKVFPSGVTVTEDHLHHQEAVTRTKTLIANKNVPAIFEAAFTAEDILIRVDILERLSRNRWRLIEVKSTTEVKDYHLPDVAIQKYMLEQSGLSVQEACLMHLNRDYVYDGRTYKLDELFTIEDLTEDIRSLEKDLPRQIAEQWKILALKKPPNIERGKQCTEPFECEFCSLCHEDLPDDWVGYLPRINQDKLDELSSMGIESIRDIPDHFPLSDIQLRVCDCVKLNKPYYDSDLKLSLSALTYPLYFMDFETIYPALPRYAGMRPFDHIPFQWSVHVQKTPKSQTEHHEFLHDGAGDPREAFINSLLPVIERDKNAPVIVYGTFESTRLDDLSRWFPRYAKRIGQIKDRLWDLLSVIRSNVYHPQFQGSFSIKNVLPVLVPELSYEQLAIADGSQAGLAYEKLVHGGLALKEKEKVRANLLEYCRLDTMAMVKLVEHLRK